MIKVAMCQTDTVGTPQENVALIGRMVKEAAENGADVAVFPEDCYLMWMRRVSTANAPRRLTATL